MFTTIFSKWHHLTEISRDLWKWYSYRDYGIIAEPYFDLDFSKVLYLTETGRRWNGDKVSVRDSADGSINSLMRGKKSLSENILFNLHMISFLLANKVNSQTRSCLIFTLSDGLIIRLCGYRS